MSDDVKQMMLDDSTDLLDNVEVTTIADQCHKLKSLQSFFLIIDIISCLKISLENLIRTDNVLN